MNIFSPASRLQRLVTGLCTLLADHLPHQDDPLPGFLVWQWLQRLIRRLETLGSRLAAGPALPPLPHGAALPELSAWPAPRAPQSRGWLLDISAEFITHADQLRLLLDDPQIQALLEDAPDLKPSLHRLQRLLDVAGPTPPATRAPATCRPATGHPPPPVSGGPPPRWAEPAPTARKSPA